MPSESPSLELQSSALQQSPAAERRSISLLLRNMLSSKPTVFPTKATPILAERPAGLIFFPLIAVALWVLTHSYQGIIGDASVYIGRALADLDPSGVGRDMMFVHDGQSRFSIMPLIIDRLVAAFGTQTASLSLVLVAMVAWVVALAAFARSYVAAPLVALVVIFVAVLPTNYGAPLRFYFAQASAVPRPLSEALVFAALASLAFGRHFWSFGFLILATLVHPLMALAGWAVFAVVLVYEDRRWIAVLVAGALLLVAAGAAGVPVLHRLFVVMDPDLEAFAEFRSPHLFPTLWPIEFLGPIFVQAASLAIAASFMTGRRRVILIAVFFAGVGGVAAQALLADHFSLLLVVQVQLWRMAWLTAAVGSAALGFCALALWRGGARSHVVLALLALAWLSVDSPVSAGLFAAAALATHFLGRRGNLRITWQAAWLLWGVACLVAAALIAHFLAGYAHFLAGMPADGPRGIRFLWVKHYLAFPILGAVLFLAFSAQSRLTSAILAVAAVFLSVAAVRFWDDRSAFQKLVDAGQHPPALARAIASRPGEILWIDSLSDTWYLTGRPQWASPQQGVSTIFSAALTHEWRKRMKFLTDEGLAAKGAIAEVLTSSAQLPRVTAANVAHLCTRPDAPAWIIAPVYKDTIIPPGLAAHEWRLPQPNFRMTEEPHFYAWHRIDAYAILPCAGSPILRH